MTQPGSSAATRIDTVFVARTRSPVSRRVELDARDLGAIRDRLPAQRPVGRELRVVLVDGEHDAGVDAPGRLADRRDRGVGARRASRGTA
jgi:hypothetical protein